MTRRVLSSARPPMILAVLAGLLAAAVAAPKAAAQRRKVDIVLEEDRIEGSIEKPEAYYILSPASLNYQSAPPEASFLPQLFKTVEQAPL